MAQVLLGNNLPDIEHAISTLQSAIEVIPVDHEELPDRLNDFGILLKIRFDCTGDYADVEEAIFAVRRAVELTPHSHPDLPSRLTILAVLFQTRYEHTRDLGDIQEAIFVQQRAIPLTPLHHPALPTRLNSLGSLFHARFEVTGDPEDIQEAISNLQKVIDLLPAEDPDRCGWLSNLGMLFYSRFGRTGDLIDLQKAISTVQGAIELAPPGLADLPDMLSNLGVSFQDLFERTGDTANIREAISLQQRAVELTPSGDPDLSRRLTNLGNAFRSHFEHMGDITDIQKAIYMHQQAIGSTSINHPDLPGFLNNLGMSLRDRFERAGDLADIQNAILAQQKALDLTPTGHPALSNRLDSLGISFCVRFKRTGDFADIREAVTTQQKAVELAPAGHTDLPGRLNNLALSFLARFEHAGDLVDIQESISALQKAVEATPPGHVDVPTWLNNLGNALKTRFESTGDLVDIQEAISVQQKATGLMPADHASLPSILNNLGVSFQTSFQRTGDLEDINHAISAQQKAVKLAPTDHENRPSILSNLGISFQIRFDRTGDLADIEEAMSVQRTAVELSPAGHADLPRRLNNLGISAQTRFERTGNLVDIQEAISVQQRAAKLIPAGHASLPAMLCNLGNSFLARDKGSGSKSTEALDCFRRAASASIGPSSVCLIAAQSWANLCLPSDPQQSLIAFARAVELLSLVAGLEHPLRSRHEKLAGVANIPLEAAATAFKLGEVEQALEWLEQGRCIVWTQLNNLRTPIDTLLAQNPTLANRIIAVSKSLEQAGSRTVPQLLHAGEATEKKMSLQAEATEHVKLAREWDRLLKDVRQLPGLESFLLPTPASAMFDSLPAGGPTIIVNVSASSCDALALFPNTREPIHIPLPQFSYDKASNLRKGLDKSLTDANLRARGSGLEPGNEGELHRDDEKVDDDEAQDDRSRGGRPIRSATTMLKVILRDLWVDVVEPIVKGLGYSSSDSSTEKPRIWWCATGPLTFLPIHAAGIYDRPDGPKVSDFAISSYTPSVSALVQRVKNPPTTSGTSGGMFIVNQPNTPGQRPIPATTDEIRIVEKHLAEHRVPYLTLEGRDANVEAGMANMKAYGSIHFACHAAQNADPLRSGFFFHDGPLELSTIIKANLNDAKLAFLSACQTSKGDERLSEEAIHLAAGMLAAGYCGVIATMWSIRDDCAPKIADLFYKELFAREVRAGGKGMNGSHAAYALHFAIEEFRKSLPDTDSALLAWIPYVHFGL